MTRGKRLAGIALLVAIAGTAMAWGAGATKVSEKFHVKAVKDGGGAVSCPQGKVPMNGGFTLQQTSSSLELRSSYPTERGWEVAVRNIEHEKRSGSADAVCTDADLKIVTERKTLSVEDAQVNAKCPKGSNAIAGGGKLFGKQGAVLIGSFPAGDGKTWGSRWTLFEPDTKLEAFAICDKHARGYEVVSDSAPLTAMPRGVPDSGTARAVCPDGTGIAGGGFFRNNFQTFYESSGPKGDGWEVSANGFTGESVNAYATCVKD